MRLKVVALALTVALTTSCGDDKAKNETVETPKSKTEKTTVESDGIDRGIGPIKSLTLGAIDEAMVAEGEKIFKAKCTACHKITKRFVGPALKGVIDRESPEWIMNMILNPEEMVVKNETARKLLIEYNNAPMANQNLTEEEARAVLEYFRTKK